MNGIFERLFGSSVAGLIGFGLMIVMFLPKIISWYKARRAKKKENTEKPHGYGARFLKHEMNVLGAEKSSASEHPEFGEAVAELKSDKAAIITFVAVFFIPMIAALSLILSSDRNYGILLIIAIFIACWGMRYLLCLRDHIVFYRTGFAGYLNGLKVAVDYNAIFEHHERSALLPWMAPTYLMRLEDNRLIVIDGTFFKLGKSLPKKLLNHLSPRVSSQAQDKLSSQ